MVGLKELYKLDDNFLKDEIRCDFLVPSEMKKVWKVQMDLLKELDSVCKEHNLQYYVDYGTLIGAVRHKGFIPWDDDLDVCMMRDDYEKLKVIGPSEFKTPYFFQNTYTDIVMFGFAKLRNSNTSAIEHPDFDKRFNQGIFIDIFPMDDTPANSDTTNNIYEIQKELLFILQNPEYMLNMVNSKQKTTLPYDIIIQLLNSNSRDIFTEYENFCAAQYGKSEYIDLITEVILKQGRSIKKKSWFGNPVLLPFENLMVPAPREYALVLEKEYGDYMKFPEDKSRHNIEYNVERPYFDYFENK